MIAEKPLDGLGVPPHVLDAAALEPHRSGSLAVAPEHVAAIAFTSGSIGEPRAQPKTWRSLVLGAELAGRRFPFRAAGILHERGAALAQHSHRDLGANPLARGPHRE